MGRGKQHYVTNTQPLVEIQIEIQKEAEKNSLPLLLLI
jgi:hypothetical protein